MPLAARPHEVALALVGYVYLVALTYAFTHVFSGLGAFTQIGALIGTIMVANVFVIIIPYQKKTVEAMLAGKEPDPVWGELGKQRSVHNNYLTLPVVFLMLSNHYPLLFATRYNWLIVAIVLAIGPVIRHFYNSRHEGKGNPWWTWGVAAAGMAIDRVAVRGRAERGDDRRAAADAQVQASVEYRHFTLQHVPRGRTGVGRHPDCTERRHARHRRTNSRCTRRLIEIFAVRSQAMPPGNITEMTPQGAAAARILARRRRAGDMKPGGRLASWPKHGRIGRRSKRGGRAIGVDFAF